MSTSVVPWTVYSDTVGVGTLTEGWNLADEGPEERAFVVQVAFDAPFASLPVVQLGMTGLDADQRDSSRVTLKPGRITTEGFEVRIATWASSRVHAVEFSWMAIGA